MFLKPSSLMWSPSDPPTNPLLTLSHLPKPVRHPQKTIEHLDRLLVSDQPTPEVDHAAALRSGERPTVFGPVAG